MRAIELAWGSMKNSSSHHFISELKEGDSIRGTYLVKHKNLGMGKTGKAFLSLQLADRSGSIDGRVWDQAEEKNAVFEQDDFLSVEGSVSVFQNRKQLVVRSLNTVDRDAVDPGLFLPVTTFDVETMFKELTSLLESIENPHVRWLSLELLRHPEIGPRYKRAPAARTVHHAMVGGLLEHSLSVVRLADFMGRYYPMLDRSYLMFGAAFHDFGKIFELEYSTSFGYTLEGRLIGHLVGGSQWIEKICSTKPDFPKETMLVCQHLVLSHHGSLEFGSPKIPATLEAIVLSMIDNLDSRVQGISVFLQNQGVLGGNWSGHHKHFNNYFYVPENSDMDGWLRSQGVTPLEESSPTSPKPAAQPASTGESRLGSIISDDLRSKLEAMAKK